MNDIRQRILQFTTHPVAHETTEIGTVHLRRLTLGELDEIQKENAAPVKEGAPQVPTTVRLLSRFLGNEDGTRAFDLAKQEDRDVLNAFPVSLAADLLRAGNRLNNMEEQKDDKPKNA